MNKELNNQNGYTPCVSTEPVKERILLTVNDKNIVSIDGKVRVDHVCEVLSLNFKNQLEKLQFVPLLTTDLYEFMSWDEETDENIWTIQEVFFYHWMLLLP